MTAGMTTTHNIGRHALAWQLRGTYREAQALLEALI